MKREEREAAVETEAKKGVPITCALSHQCMTVCLTQTQQYHQ